MFLALKQRWFLHIIHISAPPSVLTCSMEFIFSIKWLICSTTSYSTSSQWLCPFRKFPVWRDFPDIYDKQTKISISFVLNSERATSLQKIRRKYARFTCRPQCKNHEKFSIEKHVSKLRYILRIFWHISHSDKTFNSEGQCAATSISISYETGDRFNFEIATPGMDMSSIRYTLKNEIVSDHLWNYKLCKYLHKFILSYEWKNA